VHILENVSLADYSTMRLGGQARYFAEAASEADLPELVDWARRKNLPFLVIGHGSNIVWRDEGFKGLVIVNKIDGRQVQKDDGKEVTVKVASGLKWDDLVAWSVDKGLTGIEFLSAIPGTVGAAPVQNIGAYGAELADVLVEVEAYDSQNGSFGAISNKDCKFSYRNSRFKSTDRGRFIITAAMLKLKYGNPQPPFYESLQKYLTSQGIADYTPKSIRESVVAVRKIRLPDPTVVNNNGSFFTNPIVNKQKFIELQANYPDMKGWPMPDDRIKLAAGWMVEKAGFKEVHDAETGIATWPGNALVLVNEKAKNTTDLLAFKQKIVDKVYEMFGVKLDQEPELLP
jgi:UDP-N-acetylmuramate dehydrogenase